MPRIDREAEHLRRVLAEARELETDIDNELEAARLVSTDRSFALRRAEKLLRESEETEREIEAKLAAQRKVAKAAQDDLDGYLGQRQTA